MFSPSPQRSLANQLAKLIVFFFSEQKQQYNQGYTHEVYPRYNLDNIQNKIMT